MSGTTIIGKNISVFNIVGPNGTVSLLGKWKSATFNLTYNYTSNTTPADATEPVELYMTYRWTAQLEGLIQGDTDSALFAAAMVSPALTVVCENAVTNAVISVTGGIDTAMMKFQQEGWEDSLSLKSIGTVAGNPSISFYGDSP